ncbi:MAG: hypothetical protein ABR909_03255, partial [Candidatus Bathyarchaeia archaeon]
MSESSNKIKGKEKYMKIARNKIIAITFAVFFMLSMTASTMLIPNARQCVANLAFLCLVSAHLASKVMDRAFSTLFNRNAATALSSI